MRDITKWTLKDRFQFARTIGRKLNDPARCTPQEMLRAAERASKEYPNEWVVFFILADQYQRVGRYVESLHACKRCVELRPSDVRSAYALGTAYNLLTRAAWTEKEEDLIEFVQPLLNGVDDLNPDWARAALEEAGLTIEVAAAEAKRWFQQALSLRPDTESRTLIECHLSTLCENFPQVEG